MLSELLTFLRQPLDKRDYRAIAVVGVLGVLVGAALGFAARPRWEMAAVGALLTLPGSLFGGVLYGPLERAKQQTPTQMTSTAYRQGVKNALACLAGLLVMWLLIGGTIWRATGTSLSFGESFGIAFASLWAFLFAWFLAAWLYGRQTRGHRLLDCGPHPSKKSYLVAAVIFPIVFLIHGSTVGSSAKVFEIAFSVLVALYCLFMAGGRLQVRENGVWMYWSLLRWGKIDSYHWADDGTWLVKVRGLFSFRRGALPVLPEYKDAFDQLLQTHGAVADKKPA
jgi:hypothetical protein